ncbi:hypothetical protein [Afipia carboxidovorans]|uniref:hypothetical protein n=1 Tax=Afipia carboxidovorans TaxID=40137 RepID=UPI00308ACBB8|nr:hypothetical protein CRBSH125_00900 [Afipia carboxidovorans]
MYVLHRDDGSITGVVTGDKHYWKDLIRVGHKFLFLASEDDRIINFDTAKYYVDVEKKIAGAPHLECLCPMEPMALTVDKTEIAADGVDVARISGIPLGSTVTIAADGRIEFQGEADDDEIELSAAEPATHIITVTGPLQNLSTSVQVVAR